MIAEFTAPDIHCDKCATRVRDAMTSQPGVQQIDIDPAAHRVKIEFDESRQSRDALKSALTRAGYPPVD